MALSHDNKIWFNNVIFLTFSQIHKTVKNVTEETTKSRTGQIEDLTFDPARTGLVWSGMEIN